MLRKIRIRTRLFFAFFIVVFFTVIVGITGFIRLIAISDASTKTMHNVSILNNLYVHNVYINSDVFHLLYVDVDDVLSTLKELQTTEKRIKEFRIHLNEYLESQKQFHDVFTPGEMQDMANLLKIYEDSYIPVLNEVVDLAKQELWEDARCIYVHHFTPIFDEVSNYIDRGRAKNLNYSLVEMEKHNANAQFSAYSMLAVVFASMIVSVVLAFVVTKSISVPLERLGTEAEKIAHGELDVHFEQTDSNDEIAHLSKQLTDTLYQLTQVQLFRLEALEAKHAQEKAEALTRAKSDFLAKMSHEIRTPMNAVIGMAELALRENLPTAAHEHVSTIKQSGQTLLAIINDILDFSKIESGKLEIVPVDYLFSSMINDIISVIRVRLLDTPIQFIADIDNNIPNALSGDEIRIRQVLLNILGNAVKYTEKGHVTFKITGEIVDEDTVNFTITVTDSGRGIKQEDIGKLFGEFIQVGGADNSSIEGTGLGLVIARNLVRAMDGDIVVHSEYGKGSTFTIILPQKIREHGTLATVEHPGEKRILVYEPRERYANSVIRTIDNLGVQCVLVSDDSEFRHKLSSGLYSFVFVASPLYDSIKEFYEEFESESTIVLLTGFGESVVNQNLGFLVMPVYPVPVANILNGISGGFCYGEIESVVRFTAPEANVLVVDDISTNLKVAEGLLRPYEMQVTLCTSGMKALNAIAMRKYDLVFMDHMMPEMDGIETVFRIRTININDPYLTTVPIIALTANAVSGTKKMFLANGFNDFLSKPIDTIKLNSMLEKWIPKEKQTRIVIGSGSDSVMRKRKPRYDLTIEGLNVEKGITMSGGAVKNYKSILAVFLRDGIEKAKQIEMCLETHDLPLYVIHVHALKSAAANIGADNVSERAEALETAGNQKDWAFIQMHTPALLSALQSLLDAIDAAIATDERGERKETADTALLNAELAKLAAAIDSVNARAIKDAAKNLQPFTQITDVGNIIDKILQNTLIGEYEEAAVLIKTLRQ